jgi:hypothetical protein
MVEKSVVAVVGSGGLVCERGLRKARTVRDCEGCGGRAVVYIPPGGVRDDRAGHSKVGTIQFWLMN